MTREIFDRRTPTFNTEPGRPANNPPAVPQIEVSELKPLTVRISANSSINSDNHAIVSRTTIEDPLRGQVRALRITPPTSQPLTHFREIPIAGGQTIGGDTSREALRRAKQKSKRRTNN